MELAFLAPALPAGAFVAILVLSGWNGWSGWSQRWSAYLSIAAILGSFAIFWIALAGVIDNGTDVFTIDWFRVGETTFHWGVSVSPISVSMIGIVSFVALMIQIYSLKYMEGDSRFGWYYAAHSFFAAAMLALVLADNLLFVYIAWEGVGLGSYLLIGFWWERKSAAEAAKKAFITTRIGDVGLLIGIILLFKATGTFSMAEIFEMAEHGDISSTTLNWSAFLIFLGAAGKSAQVPLHVWLPDAMEGPTPVSALIHAATMVAAGVYLMAVVFPLYENSDFILRIIAGVGLVTALGAALIAVVMTDMKRVLAYSTVSHLGFMMLAIGAGAPGVAMFHLLVHAFAKAVQFLGAGSVNHGTHETDIRKMGGLRRKMPLTTWTFIIAALSLAGVPPLAGFFSKDEILRSIPEGRISEAYLVLALIAVGTSAIYTSRLIYRVFFGELSPDNQDARESPIHMTGPMILLAIGGAIAGAIVFELPGLGDFEGFVAWVLPAHGHGAIQFTWWLTATATVVASLGLWGVFKMHQSGPATVASVQNRFPAGQKLLENKFYFDELYQWGIDRVMLVLAGLVGWFDRAIVNDHGVDDPAKITGWTGAKLKYVQTGRVYNYALGMSVGAIAAAVIWWAK